MLTCIYHVMICFPDLTLDIDAYTRIRFNIFHCGAHPGRGTHNAIAFNQEDYLELLSIRDAATHGQASGGPDGGLAEYLARGGGFRYVVVQSDDLIADVDLMRR